MSKSVVFVTCTRIACAGQSSPEVILCLDSDDLLATGRSTIEGVLTTVYKLNGNCGEVSWRYVVSYDNELLTDPSSALTSDDVNGIFCKGCLTSWIEELVEGGGGGGTTRVIQLISTDTTAAAATGTDYVYFVSGTTTLTLPTAVGNKNRYTVKNVGSDVVTVAFTAGQTGDGSATLPLPVSNTSLDLISNTTNWYIV